MIAVESEGQFANRMFQLAFAYACARKFSTPFVIAKPLHKNGPAQYFDFSFPNLPHLRSSFQRYGLINSIRPRQLVYGFNSLLCLEKKPVVFDDWKSPLENLSKLTNNSRVSGFFQSMSYFLGYDQEVKSLFSLSARAKSAFTQWQKEQQPGNYLVLHVRRSDYLTTAGSKDLGSMDVSLPLEYYQNALKKALEVGAYDSIYVVGDEPEFLADLPRVKLTRNSLIVDFQIIMHASAAVISNSTFAWWSSYLNPNPDKKVYVPRYWLGWRVKKEFPQGILHPLPLGFRVCDV